MFADTEEIGMPLDSSQQSKQRRLKEILQEEISAGDFEHLTAALVSRLLNVGIAVAKSGFQFGGDAGPGGRQERRFRIETKRYADTTSLSQRELLGELDHAMQRDSALEGWFLTATREVPEQLEEDLLLHGEKNGVPVVVIDCKSNDDIWSLTALCSADPEILDSLVSKEAGDIVRDLESLALGQRQRLERDCQAWQLGFETLRKACMGELQRIWETPQAAIAKLGQDAAGGYRPDRVQRRNASQALDRWWINAAGSNVPAAIVGSDGVGKTWAVLDWLNSKREDLPITLVIPASMVSGTRVSSSSDMRRFIADLLVDITKVRDHEHWTARLNKLLHRPADDGPVLTLVFDGLNQVSAIPWIDLFRTLQDEEFIGRVRWMATTRAYHFEEKLRSLTGLSIQPERIDIGPYDDAELDIALAYKYLKREDLHPELIPLARTPRLFALVIKFRDRLIEAGSITPHRLLWEYGKDTLGPQGGRAFSEREWREWLQQLATKVIDGGARFSRKSLAESAGREDLNESEVFARMSDLIDGNFVNITAYGYEATPTIVAHALGLALLIHLDEAGDSAEPELDRWLDAIAGLDERAEILRAAISIMVARAVHLPDYAQMIVVSWLQSQNIPDTHFSDLIGLARSLVAPLLSAIEKIAYVHRSARQWAVESIRSLPRNDTKLGALVVAKSSQWLRVVSRDVEMRRTDNGEAEARRSARLIERIGVDRSGAITILGTDVTLVDHSSNPAIETIPTLIEGFPLKAAIPVFEAAALAFAINSHDDIWNGLKWLVLFNALDHDETAGAIRIRAMEILALVPEQGIHPDIAKRVAALLLWLISSDEDDAVAHSLSPALYSNWSYDKDYLANPGRSFLALERRHVNQVLDDKELTLTWRLSRTETMWLDPAFSPPPDVIDEIRASYVGFPVNELDTQISQTKTDFEFEENEVFLARAVPDVLAELIREKLKGLGARPASSRFWVGARIRKHTLLWDSASVEAARQLRESCREETEDREMFVGSNLMMIEILDRAGIDQFNTALNAQLGNDVDFEEILGELSVDQVDEMISRFGDRGAPVVEALLALLLSAHVPLSEAAWNWLTEQALSGETKAQRSIAFEILTISDAKRFGAALLDRDWGWAPSGLLLVNHYGSQAVAEATRSVPFDQLVIRLAPWLLLAIARQRGSSTQETLLAAQILDVVLRPATLEMPDLGSRITVHSDRREDHPFSFSLTPRPVEDEGDPAEKFRAMFDNKSREEARHRAVETALERMEDARQAGASLYLITFQSEDLTPVFKVAPDLIAGWVEGAIGETADFRRRVLLAEGFYIALCEAALQENPELGITLWRALKRIGTSGFIGASGVPELIHIPFRVRPTPQSAQILDELVDISNARTDRDLLDLAIAASLNGRGEWLDEMIDRDAHSDKRWQRWRSEVLAGFRTGNTLPIDEAWAEGVLSATEHRQVEAARWRLAEAEALHWWEAYLSAPTEADAYAAWILFEKCADRRILSRVKADLPKARSVNRLDRLKRAHAKFNQGDLRRAIEKAEKKLGENFLGRKIYRGISPWITD
ncbi:hypothetical protein [Mesorhizobium sp. NPDC059025]|uniref:hypothetical protein n=1 Tax=unclassified Mesorhizobium TaxID=325217 RepID=UPI0036C9421C